MIMNFLEMKNTLKGFVENRKIAFKAKNYTGKKYYTDHLSAWLANVRDRNDLKRIAVNRRNFFEELFSDKRPGQKEKISRLLDELAAG